MIAVVGHSISMNAFTGTKLGGEMTEDGVWMKNC